MDLHEIYGADVGDPEFVRPWPWWRDRIIGLVNDKRSRLSKIVSA